MITKFVSGKEVDNVGKYLENLYKVYRETHDEGCSDETCAWLEGKLEGAIEALLIVGIINSIEEKDELLLIKSEV